LFGRGMVALSLLLGGGVFLVILSVFGFAMYGGMPVEKARTLAFTTLIVSNIALILANRSWSIGIIGSLKKPNAALWWLLGGATVFLGLVLYIPFLQSVFRFSGLRPLEIGFCVVAGLAGVLWFEWFKVFRKGRV